MLLHVRLCVCTHILHIYTLCAVANNVSDALLALTGKHAVPAISLEERVLTPLGSIRFGNCGVRLGLASGHCSGPTWADRAVRLCCVSVPVLPRPHVPFPWGRRHGAGTARSRLRLLLLVACRVTGRVVAGTKTDPPFENDNNALLGSPRRKHSCFDSFKTVNEQRLDCNDRFTRRQAVIKEVSRLSSAPMTGDASALPS